MMTWDKFYKSFFRRIKIEKYREKCYSSVQKSPVYDWGTQTDLLEKKTNDNKLWGKYLSSLERNTNQTVTSSASLIMFTDLNESQCVWDGQTKNSGLVGKYQLLQIFCKTIW